MNQRPQGLKVQKALTGFLHYKSAEGLAPVTVSGYERDLKLWIEYQGDMNISKVQSADILSFLNYLRTDYVPRRITGNNSKKLAPKTVYNIYVSLASFFTWASREFQLDNPMKNIPRLRVPKDSSVEPFKKEEIEQLIKACDYCKEAVTGRRRKFVMQRFTSKRDKAIILALLDTGLRASELCALRVEDVDMKSGRVSVRPGEAGKAKGGKGRIVFIGKSARRFLWRYLAEREDGNEPDAPLFVGKLDRPFNRDALRQLIKSLGPRSVSGSVILIVFGIPLPSRIYAQAAISLRSKHYSVMGVWTWSSTMPGLQRWISSRPIEKPARLITGDCRNGSVR